MRPILGMLLFSVMILIAGVASGQSYPTKPIRIFTFGVGGASDFTARLIAQGITGPLGQPVVVENRPTGVIPGDIVAKAPPDGYSLLVVGGTFWNGPLLQATPYDPIRDFSPITLANRSPLFVTVHPSLPVKSIKELIALAKGRPGVLNYASDGAGGPPHLAAEYFKSMAGVDIVGIRYKSGASQMAELIGGHVQLIFGNAAQVTPHIKSAKLRALAVTSAQPSVLAPNLPTVSASGLPGYEVDTMTGAFSPAKTPDAIIKRLNQEMVRYLKTVEARDRFLGINVEAVGTSPEEFGTVVRSEMARMEKVVKSAGIRGD